MSRGIRFALDKQIHGGLVATSEVEMLGADNPATGTAGCVAIEHVTGTLAGHSGSFAPQRSGTMEHAKFELSVKVVPCPALATWLESPDQ